MAISLEQWEQKTQLTETELQSVYDLQDACEELPLPTNWVFKKNEFLLIEKGERIYIYI